MSIEPEQRRMLESALDLYRKIDAVGHVARLVTQIRN